VHLLPALTHALDVISEQLEQGKVTVGEARALAARIVRLRDGILRLPSTTES
jgi:hypothetical protein